MTPVHPGWSAGAAGGGAAGLVAGTARGEPIAPWPVQFHDVADRAGLRTPSIYGGVDRKRFIIETNGAGVAWIDLDDDGWVDAIVLGGTRLAAGARHDDPGDGPRRIDDAGVSQSRRRHVRRRHRAFGTRPHGLGLVDLRRRLRQRRGRRPPWSPRLAPTAVSQSRRRPVRRSQRRRRPAGHRDAVGIRLLVSRLRPRRRPRSLRGQLPDLRSRDGAPSPDRA